MYTWNCIIHVRKINMWKYIVVYEQASTIQFNSVQCIDQFGTLNMTVQAKELQNFSLISERLLNITVRGKMQLFKLRPLVVSGPDSCTGQSVCPVGLPAVCRGAPHVSDHTSPRTQRMLCKNSHPCSGQYRLHHAGIVVTNQNLWNWLSNIFMLSTCLGCTRACCHITWSPLPILIFFILFLESPVNIWFKNQRGSHYCSYTIQ